MIDKHLIDFIITDEEIFVGDGIVLRGKAVKGVGARRPKIWPEHVQISYLFRMGRIELEKVLASLSHSFDGGSDGDEDGSFILWTADYDAGDFVRKWFRWLVTLYEFTFFILPVLELFLISDHDCNSKPIILSKDKTF